MDYWFNLSKNLNCSKSEIILMNIIQSNERRKTKHIKQINRMEWKNETMKERMNWNKKEWKNESKGKQKKEEKESKRNEKDWFHKNNYNCNNKDDHKINFYHNHWSIRIVVKFVEESFLEISFL